MATLSTIDLSSLSLAEISYGSIITSDALTAQFHDLVAQIGCVTYNSSELNLNVFLILPQVRNTMHAVTVVDAKQNLESLIALIENIKLRRGIAWRIQNKHKVRPE